MAKAILNSSARREYHYSGTDEVKMSAPVTIGMAICRLHKRKARYAKNDWTMAALKASRRGKQAMYLRLVEYADH